MTGTKLTLGLALLVASLLVSPKALADSVPQNPNDMAPAVPTAARPGAGRAASGDLGGGAGVEDHSALEAFTQRAQQENKATLKAIRGKGDAADGNQTTSAKTAEELKQAGSSRAATVGALFCAQGANASMSNDGDAPAYYAGCQQNFSAAKLMSPEGTYQPDQATLNGPLARQTLSEFEKNFSVSSGDFLSRMLGSHLGAEGLAELVGGKITDAKLAADLEAAAKIAPGSLSEDSDRYAVNFGGPKAAKLKPEDTLRDKLKKDLLSKGAEGRDLASSGASGSSTAVAPEKYETLQPLTDPLFARQEAAEELTLFDVVHSRYTEIRKRWRP